MSLSHKKADARVGTGFLILFLILLVIIMAIG